MNNRDQFEESYSKIYGTPKCVLENLRQTHADDYRETDGDRLSRAWYMWKESRTTHDIQYMKDVAHCLSDLRRFIEMKWPTIADLPSVEGVLLNGPENKHEVDALIAALNRVADFYEDEQPAVKLPDTSFIVIPKDASRADCYRQGVEDCAKVLKTAGITVKSD